MKKTLHYNTTQYSNTPPDVNYNNNIGRPTLERSRSNSRAMVLDLSGKVENGSFAMLTGHEWSNEQEAALDLSGYGRPEQNEALDLTKSNTSNAERQVNQSYMVSNNMHQSQHPMHTKPTSRNAKPPAGQPYSLLQAALNSSQPTTGLHPAFDRISIPTAMLDSRSLLFAGLHLTDGSRSIKPFSSVSSRSLGMSVPHIAFANSAGAIIQGTPKPIAITTPQPHSSSGDTKGQTIADNNGCVTFGNQSVSSTSNNCYSVCQSNYDTKLQNQVGRKLNSGKSVNDSVMNTLCELKTHESLVERYLIRPSDGLSHMMGGSTNLLPVEAVTSFTCSQCPKSFKTKAALKLHTTVHKTSEERQYGCTVCQRRFLHQHHLVVHMRKHSGEKPFKCDACSKTFMAIFLLHKHLRKHSKEAGLFGKISFDQLKQLQEKKLISVGSDSVHDIISSSSMKSMNEPVVVSDNEDLASPNSNMHVAFVEGKLHSNVNRNDCEVREHSVASLNVALQSGNLNYENTDSTKEYKTIEKNIVNSESKAITKCHTHIEAEMNISHSDKQEIKNSDGKYEITKQNVEKNKEMKDVTNIIPENSLKKLENKFENDTVTYPLLDFKPGDEVELDFETGVLKVVSKKDMNVESEAFTSVNEKAEYTEMNSKTDKKLESVSRTVQFDSKVEEDDMQQTNYKHTVQNFADDNIGYSKKLESAMCCENIECVQDDLKIRNSQVISKNIMTDTNRHYELVQNTKVVHGVQNTYEMKSEIDHVALDILSVMEGMKHKLCDDGEGCTFAKNIKLDSDILKKESICEETLILALTQADKRGSLRQKIGKKCRKVKCEICCRTFHSNHYLLLHMAVHKRNPMLQSLKKAKDYQMKALGFVNKINVTCEICKKIFKFQKSLISRKRVHSEKLIEQKLFRKAFRDFRVSAAPQSNMAIDKSQSVHNSESQVMHSVSVDHSIDKGSIMECSKSVIETDNLENVKNDLDIKTSITTVIDKDNINRFVCYACDKMYTTKQKLQMHALIHKDHCYLCDICGKTFLRQISLENHISSHMLLSSYICNVCKKSSKHRGSHTRHKVAHEKSLTSALKQKPDISSEIKTLDTYLMLNQQSMQKKLLMKEREAKEFTHGKHDPLDLTVNSDVTILPKLSSAVCVQNLPPSNSWNLRQPLITDEIVGNKCVDIGENIDNKSEVVGQAEYLQGKILKEIPDNRSVYFINEKPFLSSDVSAFLNRTCRKSRVYQTTCRMCQEAFPNVMMLKSHMSVHSVVETHLYECHICRHRFTQSCSLLRHLKTSCQENKMKCVQCNRIFHKRSTFEQHMLLHQGVPPSSLDGSFYEKIREAAVIRDAPESDNENNNSCKAQILPPLTLDIIDLFETKEISRKFREEEANETDSDERTYLYSEGEVHSQFSDLSDNDWSPPSPRLSLSAQDLSVVNNNISLNLLSAVCSDIRNAEQEAELNRKMLEDRQKELETIEILASLRQRTMYKSESPKINSSMGPLPCQTAIKQGLVPCQTSKSHSQIGLTENLLNCVTTSVNDVFRVHSVNTTVVHNNLANIQPFAIRNDTKLLQTSSPLASQTKKFLEIGHSSDIQHSGTNSEYIPSFNEACISSMPMTPTTVLDVFSETHSRQKYKEEKLWQNRSINLHNEQDELSARDELVPEVTGPESFQHLSLVKSIHPACHETHSLPMKSQVPKFSPHLCFSACSSSPSTKTATITSSVQSHDAAEIQRQLVPVSQYKCDIPHDLSVKKLSQDQRPISDTSKSVQDSKSHITTRSFQEQMSPNVTEAAHIFHRSRTSAGMSGLLQRSRSLGTEPASFLENKQIPPRLVPMYQCDLCSRFIYSKTDLYIHMKEHGRSPGSLASLFPENINQMTGTEHHSPLDFSRRHSEVLSIHIPNRPKVSPPQTLNISTEKSHNHQSQSTFLNLMLPRFEPQSPGSESILTCEMLSPMTDSSQSEILSSPTTPTSSSCNLDVLRQELRLKIYARRRSQGLDDLKVEFKTPEPAEMTEEEKLKLVYRRECNRQAAQRSRMRKKDLVDSLLEELHKEEIVNSDLRRKMELLMWEKNSLLKALHSHNCIQDSNSKSCENDADVKACTQEIDSISSDSNNELQSSDKELQSSDTNLQSSDKDLQSNNTNLQSSDKGIQSSGTRAGEDQDCISKNKMMVSDFLVTNDR